MAECAAHTTNEDTHLLTSVKKTQEPSFRKKEISKKNQNGPNAEHDDQTERAREVIG